MTTIPNEGSLPTEGGKDNKALRVKGKRSVTGVEEITVKLTVLIRNTIATIARRRVI